MPSEERIRDLANKLPIIREWFDDTVAAYQKQALPLAQLDLPSLSDHFPPELLGRTRAVLFSDAFPFPPFAEIGLTEFSQSQNSDTYEAMTYRDTIFLREGYQSEVLYFHELVHVIQWSRLGRNNFLLAYITGLLESGYSDCPLEKMAFSLQEQFRQSNLPRNVTELIHKLTDTVWHRLVRAYSLA